jgi:RNA polymerase sigma-70 factor (ECF subfamily)
MEEELVKGCLEGRRECFNALYDLYARDLYAICLRYCSSTDEAEDLLQEAFVKIFRSFGKFDRNKGPLRNWVKRIVVNLCIDTFRKNSHFKYKSIDSDVADDSEDSVQFPELDVLSHEELLHMISKLSPGYRTVFNLYVFEEKSHKEIAEALDIKESTSKTQLMKARLCLQKMISDTMTSKIA